MRVQRAERRHAGPEFAYVTSFSPFAGFYAPSYLWTSNQSRRSSSSGLDLRAPNPWSRIRFSNFPIPDFRFPISNSQFPISNFRLPISDFRFPISDSPGESRSWHAKCASKDHYPKGGSRSTRLNPDSPVTKSPSLKSTNSMVSVSQAADIELCSDVSRAAQNKVYYVVQRLPLTLTSPAKNC